MKTKEIIQKLQKIDPDGNTHVRFNGGALLDFEPKEGYWDGAYEYYDKDNGTLTITTQGSKIDAHFIDWQDIVWEEGGDMTKIKRRIKYDVSNFVHNREKENTFWNEVEDEARSAKNYRETSHKGFMCSTIEKIYAGDRVLTKADCVDDINMINTVWIGKKKRDCSGICGGELDILINDDIFEIINTEPVEYKYGYNGNKKEKYFKEVKMKKI